MAENQPTLCRICREPASRTSKMVTDEDGYPVHEECYVRKQMIEEYFSTVSAMTILRQSRRHVGTFRHA
jgi:hypothetical protein